ncbi:unnamed protein product, partial [Tetraodon nigroviridis]
VADLELTVVLASGGTTILIRTRRSRSCDCRSCSAWSGCPQMLKPARMSEFLVEVQKSDAATRCDLQGAYWLQVGQEALLLKDTQKKSVLREWPYEMLRRYGKDKGALTIEAGRRCESGPGSFIFETPQAEKIFYLIQATIKQKTSPQTQETPDLANMAAGLHTLSMQGRKCSSPEDSPHAPITLMPLPSIPTHSSHPGSQSEAVYADP